MVRNIELMPNSFNADKICRPAYIRNPSQKENTTIPIPATKTTTTTITTNTNPGAHPTSCTMGTGSHSRG
jgi:hypothetical protein